MGRKAKGYLELTLKFKKCKDGGWEAWCEELGTSTCGDTLEQVYVEIVEFVSLKVKGLNELGELGRFIEKHGIEVRDKLPREDRLIDLPREEGCLIGNHFEFIPLTPAMA